MAQSGGLKLLGGRLTVSTEPFFWLMAGFIGMSFGGGSPREILMWAAAVAFSVLIHELGHAAICLAFGSGADVTLHGMGGSTRPRDTKVFGTWRTAALNLAGCAAGAALAAAAFGVLYVASVAKIALPPEARRLTVGLVEINVWFSLFNLLPVMPMDGGKFVNGLLRARWGVNGERAGHAFGLTLGAAAALWFLWRGSTYMTILTGAMAVGEGRSLKRSLDMTEADADESLRAELPRALELWERQRREEAVEVLKALREKTKAGLIYADATLQLAFWLYMMGRGDESYELFKGLPEGDLPSPARFAYADAARGRKDFETALRLGRTNFHDRPGAATAAAAALAAAGLGDARETVQWLKTAVRHGLAKNELRAKEFDAVRRSAEFKELEDDLSR
jgi:Zn-dependent protease